MEGGGVKERKNENRERGQVNYFKLIHALVSAWTCFGTLNIRLRVGLWFTKG